MAWAYKHSIFLRFATEDAISAHELSSLVSDLQRIGDLAAPRVYPPDTELDGQSLPYTIAPLIVTFSRIEFASPLSLTYFYRVPRKVANLIVRNTGEIFQRLLLPAQMERRATLQNELLRQEVLRKGIENAGIALKMYERLPADMRRQWLNEVLEVQTRFVHDHPRIITAEFRETEE